jgi:hypothetical protein
MSERKSGYNKSNRINEGNVRIVIIAYNITMADVGRKYFDILSSQYDVKNGYK